MSTPVRAIINPAVGADPEVLVYAETLDMIVPSFDLVGGTKDAPKPLSEIGFFIQEDNVMVEYNIPPAETKEKFVANIHKGLDLVKSALPEGFSPLIRSSYRFDKDSLTDRRAFIMGCEPDFNVYLNKENDPPSLENDPYLRAAGGHIHISYDNPNTTTSKLLVRFLDTVLAITSVVLDPDIDRRTIYGKAGACRLKPYGVEYRTLSSFWLTSDELTGWVWDQTMLAIYKLNNAQHDLIKHEAFIIDTINTGNVKSALKFIKEHDLIIP